MSSEPFDEHHALFIAESRPSYWLPRVIQNFRKHHPTWPIYLIGSPDVFRLVLTSQGSDGIIPLPFPAPTSPAEYSQLLLSTALWNAIHHDHVLIFQLDTICLRPVPLHLYDNILLAIVGGSAHAHAGPAIRRRDFPGGKGQGDGRPESRETVEQAARAHERSCRQCRRERRHDASV